LPGANALIEGATFVAILSGTILGGLLARGGGNGLAFAACVIGFATAAWLAALLIPPSGKAAPMLRISANIVASTAAMLRHLGADRRLVWGVLVTSWFWLTGIVVLSLLPPLIKDMIGGDEIAVTIYLALFTIAVAFGSGLAAQLARGRIRLGITVLGAVLIGLFALDLALAGATMATQGGASSALGIRAGVDLFGLAASGGLFIVPAFAAVQAWARQDMRARTVAGVNVLNAAFMTGGTVAVALLQSFGATLPMLFAAIGAATLLVAAAIWKTMPKA
jgi:hypothetical protein